MLIGGGALQIKGEKLETKSYVCHWRDDFFCSHTRAEALLLAKNHPSHVTKITILSLVAVIRGMIFVAPTSAEQQKSLFSEVQVRQTLLPGFAVLVL